MVTVTRVAISEDRCIIYYSDGRARLFEGGGGRDEPVTVPEPEEHEYEFDEDLMDQWTRAETEFDVPEAQPFNKNDENFWDEHMEEEEDEEEPTTRFILIEADDDYITNARFNEDINVIGVYDTIKIEKSEWPGTHSFEYQAWFNLRGDDE